MDVHVSAVPLLFFSAYIVYFVIMSTKYKFTDSQATYFVTATVVDWIDVFTRNNYKDILLDSIRHSQKNQGLQVHAWVLMPNPRLTGRAGFAHDLFCC